MYNKSVICVPHSDLVRNPVVSQSIIFRAIKPYINMCKQLSGGASIFVFFFILRKKTRKFKPNFSEKVETNSSLIMPDFLYK